MDQDELKNEENFSLEENPDEDGVETAGLTTKLKKLRAELKTCHRDKGEYLAGWQRAKADYFNLKKEIEGVRAEATLWAKEALLSDLFGLADSFELAFADSETWQTAPENWRVGVEYIYQQLQSFFRDQGLEEINPAPGQKFDPREHDSVATVPAASPDEDDLVDGTIKRGYKLKTKVLRPATVKVKHWVKN
ncbi:MAG: nucleotide exchange factor GrpE [Candidatus Vogelbacteria bacterium CG10_big_fil_rev_8_21_14_0_10_49_38]|uniref:Protein GrpE n=1 Tax=Candidatus Vogelbacteria bacterium CG10_big_fil_rev_8_21_14_0_10_49_38 TaxID=1975043 RepID=A0A2H0RH24_9BACT|nr:MAG: nucleotide exchange factor GrpE [bacterium CG10_49_38]PIR45861.1 MAG: nucleotide exchange factor GrpE [Candidatus Vogelbacteria bacterium CG10_big_fil_rev_8_21_14_0_10_49_38]